MQTSRILAIGEISPELAELVRLLSERYAVSLAQSMTDIERAAEQPPILIIAERRCLQRLNFESVSAMIQNIETLWMLLDNDSAADDDDSALLSRMYFVIPAPCAPEMAYHLALRAIEHAQLVREHEQLVCEHEQLVCEHEQLVRASEEVQPSRSRVPESAPMRDAFQQEAVCENMTAQQWGEKMSSEKFAMLGQMLAGIIHEINTPSGAINAAVVNVQHHLKTLLESGSAVSRLGMKPEETLTVLRIFGNMLNALEGKPRRHSGEIRNEQKALAERLTQRNVPDAAKLAREVARLGISPWLDEALLLFEAYSVEPLLAFLTSWHRIIHSAQDIKLSNEMLTRMVRAVKSYSYPWQDRQELADIQESLDTALILLANKFKHKITLATDFAELPAILCNPSDLTHVWLNLLHNAIQAIDGDGEIRIETFATKDYIGVRVTDTGNGIPSDILPKIFAPNFTTKSREEGTGFGLYLVRQILDKHQATIEVSSVPGHTTFEVRLPR